MPPYVPPNSALSASAFIGSVVSMAPFYWHVRAGNVGTCLFMFWTSLSCLNLFINSRIWDGNTRDVAHVWCDISSRVLVAQNVAIPASILCITRRLYKLTVTTVINKRREAYIDLGIGLGIPILEVLLYCIVQGHRYNLFEDVGCWPVVYDTLPAFGLVFAWPLVIAVISATYGLCGFYRFVRHGREVRALVFADKAKRGRYIRLILIAGCDILGTIPLSIYDLYSDSLFVSPWISWEYVHSGFSEVNEVPASLWHTSPDMAFGIQMTQWVTVACAFVFFTLFGIFSQGAIDQYQHFYELAQARFASSTPSAQYVLASSTSSSIPDDVISFPGP
ncbi:fungal pheromone STE3G-protein-coupled receptor [Artomyces pyxidatus]|uniref:Fungal pheromone STE3G-protein-coupled receptor n=1 Tax=Artomyces pyxidatus TaxID=48021 RepID=A0ACB8T2P9_9AGAM|nr:fungal pheromone STE3G-protein-coupled receptor [Artomyces pyxidatus]